MKALGRLANGADTAKQSWLKHREGGPSRFSNRDAGPAVWMKFQARSRRINDPDHGEASTA